MWLKAISGFAAVIFKYRYYADRKYPMFNPVIRLVQLIIYSVLGGYILVGLMLFLFQRKSIYFPTPPIHHPYPQIEIKTDGQVMGVISLHTSAEMAVLYFGGNAESVAYSAQEFDRELAGIAVYLVNYRGYGGNSGSPSEKGLYIDALHAFDYLANKYDHVYVIGRSLGSGVATYVAANRPVAKLVLVTPFDSILSIAQARFPVYPVSMMLWDRFDSVARAEKIQSPTLVLVAEHDRVVGAQHSNRLIESLKHLRPEVLELEGSSHNTISDNKLYYQTIKIFLNQ